MSNLLYKTDEKTRSYIQFIWNTPLTRKYLIYCLSLCILQFIIFKLLYPYPDFFSDSYYYIFAAYANLDVSVWPIGYSKFLGWVHHLTYSDTVVVAIQYFGFQLATLHVFFSVLYFYNTTKLTRIILFIFFFVNPLTLYLCNTINSDALFIIFSLLWFTELIWIINRPHKYRIFTHAVLLFICFTIRNNAYYYPIISAIVFIMSHQNWRTRIAGIITPLLLIIPFVIHTQNEAQKLTGKKKFSLFTGWQLANNALYIYDQIKIDSLSFQTAEARELNRLSISFFRKYTSDDYRTNLESFVGNFFIKEAKSPLKQYFFSHYDSFKPKGNNSWVQENIALIQKWGKASSDFENFGKTIIVRHPFAYGRYFVWPNAAHYIMPPLSHLEEYNYGSNEIEPTGRMWFHYPNTKIYCISNNAQGFLVLYSGLFLFFNLLFIWQLIQYIRIFKLRFATQKIDYWFASLFVLSNFLFSICATVNILRYQIFPMFVLLVFGLVIGDELQQIYLSKKAALKYKSKISSASHISINAGL